MQSIRKNDIKSKNGEDFGNSPEFFKMKEFKKTYHKIYAVLFLEPEKYRIREFDVILHSFVQEKWDKRE